MKAGGRIGRIREILRQILYPEGAICLRCGAVSGGECLCPACRRDLRQGDVLESWETREVAGVLKPGGTFLIVNESDGTDPSSQRFEQIIDGMTLYPPAEIEAALRAAGFSTVETRRYPEKPWIAVLAGKA